MSVASSAIVSCPLFEKPSCRTSAARLGLPGDCGERAASTRGDKFEGSRDSPDGSGVVEAGPSPGLCGEDAVDDEVDR